MKENIMETKRLNKIRIAQFISQKGSTSKNEIASSLHISMPTTLQNVRTLLEEGLIEETGEYESTGGRKAKALSVSENAGFAAGMDITSNHITLVLVSMKRELITKERIRLPFADNYAYYQAMGSALERFLDGVGKNRGKITGVGISLPGIVDREKKVLLGSQVLGVTNTGFQSLQDLTGLPLELENDANSAAYAELSSPAGCSGTYNTVYLSLSNTVGGAVYLQDGLYPGENFKSGEFGHMIIEKNGRPCYCGKKGCADAYCSAGVLHSLTEGSLDLFFDRLRAGEPEYVGRWEEYLDNLAVVVGNLRMAFDCGIVLGGYVGGYLGEFLPELKRKVMEYNTFDPDASYLRTGRHRLEASAYGAALMLVDKFFQSL